MRMTYPPGSRDIIEKLDAIDGEYEYYIDHWGEWRSHLNEFCHLEPKYVARKERNARPSYWDEPRIWLCHYRILLRIDYSEEWCKLKNDHPFMCGDCPLHFAGRTYIAIIDGLCEKDDVEELFELISLQFDWYYKFWEY